MVRKKIDNRIRVLIENGVSEKHRTMFVVIGDHGRDQVSYDMYLSELQIKSDMDNDGTLFKVLSYYMYI